MQGYEEMLRLNEVFALTEIGPHHETTKTQPPIDYMTWYEHSLVMARSDDSSA